MLSRKKSRWAALRNLISDIKIPPILLIISQILENVVSTFFIPHQIVADTDLYETDKEVQNLIDWVCLSEQIKENNNTIRSLTGEYKKIEPDCREGVRAQLERMKQLCKERNSLYEKQNDLKGQKYRIEKLLER
jgi:hypothetical protein